MAWAAQQLDLLQLLNDQERITWQGKFRPPLHDAVVVPRPEHGRLPLWLGTGGSPGSSVRAGQRGLPVIYGILGGAPASFARLADLYRHAATTSGHLTENVRVGVANPGFVGDDGQRTKDMWWGHRSNRMEMISRQRGFPMMSRESSLERSEGVLDVPLGPSMARRGHVL